MGWFTNQSAQQVTLAVVWNGPAWTAQPVP
jgi:hypothetical protein